VRNQNRSLSLLLAVALLATALTLALSATGAPLQASQTSPLQPSSTVPATAATLPTADVAAPTGLPGNPPPVATFPPLDAPTSVPLPAAGAPSPTASGFLPAPTITNPDEVKSLPLARPAISGGGGDEDPLPTATPGRAANPALAASVAILNVLWLICGSALLIGGVVFIIVLARRQSDS
jgi:hypothetical protein